MFVAGSAVARCVLGREALHLLAERRRLCGCLGFRLGGPGLPPSYRFSIALGDSALLVQAEDYLLRASEVDPERRLVQDVELGLAPVLDEAPGVWHALGELLSVASGDHALNPVDPRPCQLGL